MALNIDLDGFGFLSDTEASKLSPTVKQQPPISPIESESSSGISSLDSDDLKKQLLSSPTISHDDEDQQSDGGSSSSSSVSSTSGSSVTASESEKEQDDSEQNEKEESEVTTDDEHDGDEAEVEEEVEVQQQQQQQHKQEEKQVVIVKPLKVLYQKRDVLELFDNVVGSGSLVQYTVLPENNVNCFFQNRAQYWRLSSGERQEYSLDKCPCCDFTYPSTQAHLNQGPMVIAKKVNPNAVTDSLLMFLKNNEQTTVSMPMNSSKRTMPFGYQMQQQQQQQQAQPPQQYQPPSNGFYNNTNSYSANYNQQINPFMNNNTAANNNNNNNNNSGYGTTLTLLNLMNNASRNAANAFQAMSTSSNTPRYFNNNMNNGYGLYKQF